MVQRAYSDKTNNIIQSSKRYLSEQVRTSLFFVEIEIACKYISNKGMALFLAVSLPLEFIALYSAIPDSEKNKSAVESKQENLVKKAISSYFK